ncbi:hypothetical protein BC834DRAFT_449315 [Gloeopeniophorella convolvens]|nr:hypothetical protein BC834DRAFT_449315 [Gloeopeniophorella convolvens]
MPLASSTVYRFFDLAAIRDDGEEEEEEEEGFLDYDGEDFQEESPVGGRNGSQRQYAPLPGGRRVEEDARDAEVQAQRSRLASANHAARDLSSHIYTPKEFILPDINSPGIWCVRVKPGYERDIVFQLARRCLFPTESHPPTITSAFSRDGIVGCVFVESTSYSAVVHAVSGLVTVLPKPHRLMESNSRTQLLRSGCLPWAQVAEGHWVRCDIGLYKGDIGFVLETHDEFEDNLVVALVPRLHRKTTSDPLGSEGDASRSHKRKRLARPQPQAWTALEALAEWGLRRVRVNDDDTFLMDGIKCDDGLIFVPMPSSHVRTAGSPPADLSPFLRSPTLRAERMFLPWLIHTWQLSIKNGTRIIVTSGDLRGAVGYAREVTDTTAEIAVSRSDDSKTQVSATVTLASVAPYFVLGDHIKARWNLKAASRGIVVKTDYETNILVYVDHDSLVEAELNLYAVEFDEPVWRTIKFTPGLWVEYNEPVGTPGTPRRVRARVVRCQDRRLWLLAEADGAVQTEHDASEVDIAPVQDRSIDLVGDPIIHLRGRDVMVTHGPLKGHKGTVKACNVYGAGVQLHSHYIIYGSREEWILWPCLALLTKKWEPRVRGPTPPPPRPRTPTRPPPRIRTPTPPSSRALPWAWYSTPQDHWIHRKEIQEVLARKRLALALPNEDESSPCMIGFAAHTIVLSKRKIEPNPGEVVVVTYVRGQKRAREVSKDPRYLVPWEPVVTTEVVVIEGKWFGWVGVVKEEMPDDDSEVTTHRYRVKFDSSFPEPDHTGVFPQSSLVCLKGR